MKNKMILIAGILLVLLTVVAMVIFYYREKSAMEKIQTFEQCKENGFPVEDDTELNIKICRTPDGRSFEKDVEVKPEPAEPLITLDSVKSGDIVKSPLILSGQARGYWFFEASFPVEVIDGEGNVLAQGIAEAQDEWMTTDFVPYTATLNFENKTEQPGLIVLHKDNPSGLPEHDDKLEIPIIIGGSE